VHKHETVSAWTTFDLMEAKIALKTEARATAGIKVPTTTRREMRETAACVMRLFLYTDCVRLPPAGVFFDLLSKIGQFGDLLSSLIR
jgi:hypothetical protein